jgi:LacI family transcriptional regulator
MTATITDVARKAKVSTATVSRVLSGGGGARDETRDRVLTAARELGYRPSGVARSLRQRATRTLGLIVTDIENPFFPELVRTVEDAARERGYAMLLCNASDDPEREAGYLELLVDRWVDGVVIAASSLGVRHREWLLAADLPIVLVNSVDRQIDLPTIASDSVMGGRIATEHLLELGHRRFGIITAGPRNLDAPDRVTGARSALRAAGIPTASEHVVIEEATVEGGQRAAAAILAKDPSVTAIVAYNDLTAIGAMRAIRAREMRVPQDVSVIGFDDVHLAAYVDPPLTTIAQSTAEMGRWAVDELTRRLGRPAADPDSADHAEGGGGEAREHEGAPHPAPHVVLPVRLRIRDSTGPAPAA